MIHRVLVAGALLAGFPNPAALAELPKRLCHEVADKIREKLVAAGANDLGLLDALAALDDKSIRLIREDPAGSASGATQATRLHREHAAPEALVHSVEALGDDVNLIELPSVPVWVFDRTSGTLGCHVLVAVWVPAGTVAQRIDLPFGNGEADLCGTSIAGAEIAGHAALIAEDASWDVDHAESKLTITPFNGAKVDAPCGVDVRYHLTFRVEHSFCRQGVDCGAIVRLSKAFADRRRNGNDPTSLAGHVDRGTADRLRSAYERMQQVGGQTENLNVVPTFNKFTSATGADQFGSDTEMFPFRIWSGTIYLARLGHGYRNFDQSIGYIFAAYSLEGDLTVPVAGVSIEPRRAAITSVKVR